MEEIKVFIDGKEDDKLTKAVTRFYEIIKDQNEPDNPVVNLDLDSKAGKELFYQTALIHNLSNEVEKLKKDITKMHDLQKNIGDEFDLAEYGKLKELIIAMYLSLGNDFDQMHVITEVRQKVANRKTEILKENLEKWINGSLEFLLKG
ncbi:hypothetical protein [Holdemania massiliensis]|uniref:hypothetical protein n=1 Tax=Holdemania massiliensis TaxID=1468449 RepID=UPI0024305EB8|nr:hypothetical protein [Holdemania massiliensis]